MASSVKRSSLLHNGGISSIFLVGDDDSALVDRWVRALASGRAAHEASPIPRVTSTLQKDRWFSNINEQQT